ncbi:MAG: NAD-dependent epimerase/dehydratase family protein [Deltaproteobacteria bacterium]|nr:NAD-dependent epimerase/dehydratase family protein [Deltaproteobacteria bacterium]
MRALVTGATGLLGYALVEELLAQGHSVRALVRSGSNRSLIDRLDIEKAVGDLRDPPSLRAAVQGCRWVFSVGALFWSERTQDVYDANVLGQRHFMEASTAAGVEKFIHVNGVTSVGHSHNGELLDEESVLNLLHLANHTEISLFLGYVETLKAAQRGCPALSVALTFLMGPNDPIPSPSGQLMVAYANRRVLGYPAGGLNFIDARDCAKGLILAAEKGRIGERYILGNVNMSFRDFFRLIEEVTGIPAPRFRLPHQLLYPIGVVAPLVSQYVTHRRPILSIPRVRMSDLTYHYSNQKAVTELGLAFRDLKDSIRDTIRWFRDNGYIANKRSLATVRGL